MAKRAPIKNDSMIKSQWRELSAFAEIRCYYGWYYWLKSQPELKIRRVSGYHFEFCLRDVFDRRFWHGHR